MFRIVGKRKSWAYQATKNESWDKSCVDALENREWKSKERREMFSVVFSSISREKRGDQVKRVKHSEPTKPRWIMHIAGNGPLRRFKSHKCFSFHPFVPYLKSLFFFFFSKSPFPQREHTNHFVLATLFSTSTFTFVHFVFLVYGFVTRKSRELRGFYQEIKARLLFFKKKTSCAII